MKVSPPFSFRFFVIRSQQPFLIPCWLSICSKCNRVNNSQLQSFMAES
jgi:hypothetical protein